MKNSQLALLIISISILFACNQSKEGISEVQMNTIVSKSDSQLMVLIGNKDADSLTKIFAADATIYPPGEAGNKGIKAIQNWYKNAYEFGLCGIKYQPVSIYGSEDQIIESGTSVISIILNVKDTVDMESYNYVNVWSKKTDSTYVLKTQIWNEGASKE